MRKHLLCMGIAAAVYSSYKQVLFIYHTGRGATKKYMTIKWQVLPNITNT